MNDQDKVTKEGDAMRSRTATSKTIVRITGILFFSMGWYLTNGLSGDFWYLAWLAPVPILFIAFRTSAKVAFFIALVACLLGRLSYFLYLLQVTSATVAVVVILLLSLTFALMVILARRAVLRTRITGSLFAFPALYTAFEFGMMKLSADGSSSSIAYSQSDCLPLLQIASVAGISGITFFITFIPSAIAISWYYRQQKKELQYVIFVSVVVVITALGFGMIRLSRSSNSNTVKVGLVVLDENLHDASRHPDFVKEKNITAGYVRQVEALINQGAQLVILPEKAININKDVAADIFNKFSKTAKQNQVSVVIGYVNYRNAQLYNSAWVIDAKGDTLADYNKAHLVQGWEDRFVSGNTIKAYPFLGATAGIAICKDLDFPDYMRSYGRAGVALLMVPAWDFVADDWLHSRMAVVRGVENGFSEIRTAREGRLTISDPYGRVTGEAISANDKEASLVGNVSLQKMDTPYDTLGDWLGIVSCVFSLLICLVSYKQKRKIDTI